MKNIAIFASGSGSNAECIVKYFANNTDFQVKLILSNKEDAPVLERAKTLGVPSIVFNKNDFFETNNVLETLLDNSIDLIVLAGFLWLVPKNLVMAFPNTIINIHPALLPKFGGKGMYGIKVHKAVIEAGEKESGISIHKVSEHYDEGDIIFQIKCTIASNDTPESLAEKIHHLEYEYFPKVIETYFKSL